MKTIQRISIIVIFITIFSNSTKAQGWIQDQKAMYSVGVGVTQVVFMPANYYPIRHRSSRGLSLNVAGEYKVHRLIGLGWQTGIDVFTAGRYYDKHDKFYYNSTVVGIPIGFKMNVHFLEATKAKAKDDLDVYVGINFGGGPSFHSNSKDKSIYGFIYGGPQFGVRYWFKKIAIFGEVGWGASLANFGVTF